MSPKEVASSAVRSGRGMVDSLRNSVAYGNLHSAIFGRYNSAGYLSPLRPDLSGLGVSIKKRAGTFGLVEFRYGDPIGSSAGKQSPLLPAVGALQIEILERHYDQFINADSNGGYCRAYLWRIEGSLDEFVQEHLIPRLNAPKFGGLPKLISQLVALVRGTNVPEGKARIDLVRRFHDLEDGKVKTFVLGELLHQTRMVEEWRRRWFDELSFNKKLAAGSADDLARLGYEEELRSLELACEGLPSATFHNIW